MSHDLPLFIALVGPIVVMTLLGINAALVFLSLCLGAVLVTYVSNDALSALTAIWPHASSLSKSMLQLLFLYVPAIVTCVLMIGSIKGKLWRLLNILPASGVALLGVLMGVPLFTPGLRQAIQQGTFWHQLNKGQALVVGVTALLSLLLLWTQHRSLKIEKPHRPKHRD